MLLRMLVCIVTGGGKRISCVFRKDEREREIPGKDCIDCLKR